MPGIRTGSHPQDLVCHQGLARALRVSITDGFMLCKQGVNPDFLEMG